MIARDPIHIGAAVRIVEEARAGRRLDLQAGAFISPDFGRSDAPEIAEAARTYSRGTRGAIGTLIEKEMRAADALARCGAISRNELKSLEVSEGCGVSLQEFLNAVAALLKVAR